MSFVHGISGGVETIPMSFHPVHQSPFGVAGVGGVHFDDESLRAIASDIQPLPALTKQTWMRGWEIWSSQRPRARMAQFIVEQLHAGNNGRWLDITKGKFELTNWPEVAQQWYSAKERDSDPCEATSMLRKGLPRAFPGLEESKGEAEKEGTQYTKRVFQVPEKVVSEVLNCALHPEPIFPPASAYDNSFTPNPNAGTIANFLSHGNTANQQPQEQFMHSLQGQNNLALLQQQQQRQQQQRQQQQQLLLQQQQQQQQELQRQQELFREQQERSQRQALLEHELLLQQQQQAGLGSSGISSISALTGSPRSESPGSSTGAGHLSESNPAVSCSTGSPGYSYNDGSIPSPYADGYASQQSHASHEPDLLQTSGLQSVLNPGEVDNRRESLYLTPNRSPLQGGGKVHLFYASEQQMPAGKVVLAFTAQQENIRFAEAERLNPFVCVARVPPHDREEEVTVFVMINDQYFTDVPFYYFNGFGLDLSKGQLVPTSESFQDVCSTLGSIVQTSSGGSAGSNGGGTAYGGNGNFQAYQQMLLLAMDLDQRALVKLLLTKSLGIKCLSVPLPNGQLIEDLARDRGQLTVGACMKSVRLRSQRGPSVRIAGEQDPLDLLSESECSLAACLPQLETAMSQRVPETADEDGDSEKPSSNVNEIRQRIESMHVNPSILLTKPSLSKEPSRDDDDIAGKDATPVTSPPVPATNPPVPAQPVTSAAALSPQGFCNLISAISQQVRQAKIALSDHSLLTSLLFQQCAQAMTERKQLASELLQARQQARSTHKTESTLQRGAAIHGTTRGSEDTDQAKTLTRGSAPPPAFVFTDYHGQSIEISDDDDEDDVDALKTKVKALQTTIVSLRTEGTALKSKHQEVKMELDKALKSHSTLSRTRTVRTRRKIFHASKPRPSGRDGAASEAFGSGTQSSGYQSSGYQSLSSYESPRLPERSPHRLGDPEVTTSDSLESIDRDPVIDAKTLMEEHELTLPPGKNDYGLELEQAFFVNAVTEGGVAEKTLGDKLQAGDIIIRINENTMSKILTEREVLSLLRPATTGHANASPRLTCITPRSMTSESPDMLQTDLRPPSLDLSSHVAHHSRRLNSPTAVS